MARDDLEVKSDKSKSPAPTRCWRVLCWLDRHPRLAWYVMIWTVLVNLDITFHWFTALLQAIGAL